VVSTHIKDGGILAGEEGITTFPSPVGKGIINLKAIIKKLQSMDKEIYLSVENHGGSFFLPVNETWFISRFPDLAGTEYNNLLDLAVTTSDKIKTGDLKITERDDWPVICEERTRDDIKNLKIIRDKLS